MAVNFYNGYIADTPATASDLVRVSVPNLTQMDRVVYGPLPWTPQVDQNGRPLGPTLGDTCLIADDDSVSGRQWIVKWSGTRSIDTVNATLTDVAVSGVGISGNKRAGRKLTVADFTTLLGGSVPIALYNFDGNANDSSGNNRHLALTTVAPTFDKGITAATAEAGKFVGNNAQGMFVADGNGGPFNFRTGSWGCWFRSAKQSTSQRLMAKGIQVAGSRCWNLAIDSSNRLRMDMSVDATALVQVFSSTIVPTDELWHFAVGTYDGEIARLYADGILDSQGYLLGTLAQLATPFNIGSAGITAAAGTGSENFPMFGVIDEAFVTGDVLNEDQVRLLMAASVPHTLSSKPVSISVAVKRRKRGGAISAANFPAAPRRLYNLSITSGVSDEGLDAATLTLNGTAVSIAAGDGEVRGARTMLGTAGNYFSVAAPSSFTGQAKSIGCWFATIGVGAQMTVLTLANLAGGASATDWRPFYITAQGFPAMWDGTSRPSSTDPNVLDGMLHFWCTVLDNNAFDGLKRKIYLDGRMIGADTSFATVSLGTNGGLLIGQLSTAGTEPYKGLIDGVFVTDYGLTAENVAALYAIGSKQMPASLLDGSIIEGQDATNLYILADHIDPQHLLDIKVAA